MLLSFYRRFSRKTNVPIAVLTIYTEKEYEPFDPYSRFYPAMPISVCFQNTALYTLGKSAAAFLEGQHKMNPLEYRIELSQHLGSFRFFFIDF